jgi:hypothetical protein
MSALQLGLYGIGAVAIIAAVVFVVLLLRRR